jgi:hypothetical protein
MPLRFWEHPEGLRVLPDGSWQVGDQPVQHPASLLYMKAHLVFRDDGAFVEDEGRLLPVSIEGPPLVVLRLDIDVEQGEVRAHLDDGRVEAIRENALAMNQETGHFEFGARGGRARAVLSRSSHQTLLQHAEEENGEFYLRAGRRRIALRT